MGTHRFEGVRVIAKKLPQVDSNSINIISPPTLCQLLHVTVIRDTLVSAAVDPALVFSSIVDQALAPYAGFALNDDYDTNDTSNLIQFTPGLPTTVMTNRSNSAVNIQFSPIPSQPGSVISVVMQGASAPTSDLWDCLFIFKQIG